jgi:hypothetical protein
MPGSRKVVRDKSENHEEKALTCIHPAYTLFDTPEPDSNGTESLMIKHFLDTLAEVSISIASRMKCKEEDQR